MLVLETYQINFIVTWYIVLATTSYSMVWASINNLSFLTLQLIRYLRVYEPDSGFKVTSSDRYSQDKEGAGAKLVVTKTWYDASEM